MTHQNTEMFHPPLEQRIDTLSKLSDLYSAFMRVERATYRDGRPETDGEHTLHVMFLAVAYTAQYHPEFDPGEVALLVMIHDLDEVYAGDVNSLTADEADMYQKEENERQDRERLRLELQDAPFLVDLLERYWAQQEPIVQYVRAFEKFDPSFAHQRDSGAAIRAMGITTKEHYHELDVGATDRMAGYAISDVVGIRRLLGQRVANAVFDTV
jgi:5'-deoxynucleotidase YfbR-like HD superfamily hydrolase